VKGEEKMNSKVLVALEGSGTSSFFAGKLTEGIVAIVVADVLL